MASCEERLMDWRSWDEVTEGVTTFFDVKLNEEVGEFPPGSVLRSVTIDCANGEIILDDGSGHQHVYSLEYHAGEKIDRDPSYDD